MGTARGAEVNDSASSLRDVLRARQQQRRARHAMAQAAASGVTSNQRELDRVLFDLLMVSCQLFLSLNHYRKLLDGDRCGVSPARELQTLQAMEDYPCDKSLLHRTGFLMSRAPQAYASMALLPLGELWTPLVTLVLWAQLALILLSKRPWYVSKGRQVTIFLVGFIPKLVSLGCLLAFPNHKPSSYYGCYLPYEGAILAWQQAVYQWPMLQNLVVATGHCFLVGVICLIVPGRAAQLDIQPGLVMVQTLCGALISVVESLYFEGAFKRSAARSSNERTAGFDVLPASEAAAEDKADDSKCNTANTQAILAAQASSRLCSSSSGCNIHQHLLPPCADVFHGKKKDGQGDAALGCFQQCAGFAGSSSAGCASSEPRGSDENFGCGCRIEAKGHSLQQSKATAALKEDTALQPLTVHTSKALAALPSPAAPASPSSGRDSTDMPVVPLQLQLSSGSLKRPSGLSRLTIAEDQEFVAPELAHSLAAVRLVLQQGGRNTRYKSRLQRQRLYMKIPFAEPDDLPLNFLERLNHALEQGSDWMATNVAVRQGCIELVIELVRYGQGLRCPRPFGRHTAALPATDSALSAASDSEPILPSLPCLGASTSIPGDMLTEQYAVEQEVHGLCNLLLLDAMDPAVAVEGAQAQGQAHAGSRRHHAATAGCLVASDPGGSAPSEAPGPLIDWLQPPLDAEVLTQACGRVFVSRWDPHTESWSAQELPLRPGEVPRLHRVAPMALQPPPAVPPAAGPSLSVLQPVHGGVVIEVHVSNVYQEPVMWVRTQGRYLPCQPLGMATPVPPTQAPGVPAASSAPPTPARKARASCSESGEVQALRLLVAGLPQDGLLVVECKMGQLLSNWKPLVVCSDPCVVGELRELDEDMALAEDAASRAQYEDFLADFGCWLEFAAACGARPARVSASSSTFTSSPSERDATSGPSSATASDSSKTQQHLALAPAAATTVPVAVAGSSRSSGGGELQLLPAQRTSSGTLLAQGSSDYNRDAMAALANPALRQQMYDTGTVLLEFACDRGWPATASRVVQDLVALGHSFHDLVEMTSSQPGLTLLHRAVRSGRPEMLGAVIEWGRQYGYEWSWDDPGGASAAHASASGVQEIFTTGEDVDGAVPVGPAPGAGMTPLHLAAALDDGGAMVDRILREYESACHTWYNTRDAYGCTPQQCAAGHGFLKALHTRQAQLAGAGSGEAGAAPGPPYPDPLAPLPVAGGNADADSAPEGVGLRNRKGAMVASPLGSLTSEAERLSSGVEDSDDEMGSEDLGSKGSHRGSSTAWRGCKLHQHKGVHLAGKKAHPYGGQQHLGHPDLLACCLQRSLFHPCSDSPEEMDYLRFVGLRQAKLACLWHLMYMALALALMARLAQHGHAGWLGLCAAYLLPNITAGALLLLHFNGYLAYREALSVCSALLRVLAKALAAGGVLAFPACCGPMLRVGMGMAQEGLALGLIEQVRVPRSLVLRTMDALVSCALCLSQASISQRQAGMTNSDASEASADVSPASAVALLPVDMLIRTLMWSLICFLLGAALDVHYRMAWHRMLLQRGGGGSSCQMPGAAAGADAVAGNASKMMASSAAGAIKGAKAAAGRYKLH